MSHRHTHFLGYKNMLEMHIAEKVSFLQNILLVLQSCESRIVLLTIYFIVTGLGVV